MSTKRRVPIPKRIETEVLFRNMHLCCVCEKGNVQIHHIDGNPANNGLPNLCVLCIEHHALASTKSTMVKGFSVNDLRRYKSEWERRIAQKRKIYAPLRLQQASDKRQLEFEIKKTVFALPTLKTKSAFNQSIDYIYHWHLFELDVKYLLKKLDYVRWFFEPLHITILADRMYEFYWQYVGPKEVPMTNMGEREVVAAVDFLGDLGIQCGLIDLRIDLTRDVIRALNQFYEIGVIYERRAIKERVKKKLRQMRAECSSIPSFCDVGIKQ